jgi:peptidoglycan/xylan/chitin deacetylase (PgdA/CDA1 family)
VTLSRYDGQAAFVHQVPTGHPVAFLTIDDGMVRHPLALELLRAAKVPVTLFLTTNYVGGNQEYFGALRDSGYATIQNHTISHPNLPSVGYGGARGQLCGASSNLEQWYGQRPIFFRPPFGEYDGSTLRAAWDCGLQAGFHWRETVNEGVVYYQRPDNKIHAGDIILMHFRPAFPDDFLAALNAIKQAGLTPALLENYVSVGASIGPPPAPPPPPTPTPTATPAPEPTAEPTPAPTEPPAAGVAALVPVWTRAPIDRRS